MNFVIGNKKEQWYLSTFNKKNFNLSADSISNLNMLEQFDKNQLTNLNFSRNSDC